MEKGCGRTVTERRPSTGNEADIACTNHGDAHEQALPFTETGLCGRAPTTVVRRCRERGTVETVGEEIVAIHFPLFSDKMQLRPRTIPPRAQY